MTQIFFIRILIGYNKCELKIIKGNYLKELIKK